MPRRKSKEPVISPEEVDELLDPDDIRGAEELAEEIFGKNKEIAPAQINPMDVRMPEAVRNACTGRMEELEKKMQEIDSKIGDLRGIYKSCEGEYKVLADYILQKGK